MSKWERLDLPAGEIIDERGFVIACCTSVEAADIICREHNAHAALLAACKWISQLQDEHDGEPFENCMLHAERIALDAIAIAKDPPCPPAT